MKIEISRVVDIFLMKILCLKIEFWGIIGIKKINFFKYFISYDDCDKYKIMVYFGLEKC